MRLTATQRQIICHTSTEIFGAGVGVWLFGSRVDDARRGGDIDIMLDIPTPVTAPALLKARFAAKVTRLLQGRKVDVLLSAPNLMRLPIHDAAFQQGQQL